MPSTENFNISHASPSVLGDDHPVFFCHLTGAIFADYSDYFNYVMNLKSQAWLPFGHDGRRLSFVEALQHEKSSKREIDKLGRPLICGILGIIPQLKRQKISSLARDVFLRAKKVVFANECVVFYDKDDVQNFGHVVRIVHPESSNSEKQYLYEIRSNLGGRCWTTRTPIRQLDTLTHERVTLLIKNFCEVSRRFLVVKKHVLDSFGLSSTSTVSRNLKSRRKMIDPYLFSPSKVYEFTKERIKLMQADYLEERANIREDMRCDDLRMFPQLTHVANGDELFLMIEAANFVNPLCDLGMTRLKQRLTISDLGDSLEWNNLLYYQIMSSLIRLLVDEDRLHFLFGYSNATLGVHKLSVAHSHIDERLDEMLERVRMKRYRIIFPYEFNITINRFTISEVIRLHLLACAMDSVPLRKPIKQGHVDDLEFCNDNIESLILLERVDVFSIGRKNKLTLMVHLCRSIIRGAEFRKILSARLKFMTATTKQSYTGKRYDSPNMRPLGCDRMYRRYWFIPEYCHGIYVEWGGHDSSALTQRLVDQLDIDPNEESWVDYAKRFGLRCIVKTSKTSLMGPYREKKFPKSTTFSANTHNIKSQIEQSSTQKWVKIDTQQQFDDLFAALNPRGFRERALRGELIRKRAEIRSSLAESTAKCEITRQQNMNIFTELLTWLGALNSEVYFNSRHRVKKKDYRKFSKIIGQYIFLYRSGGDLEVFIEFFLDCLYSLICILCHASPERLKDLNGHPRTRGIMRFSTYVNELNKPCNFTSLAHLAVLFQILWSEVIKRNTSPQERCKLCLTDRTTNALKCLNCLGMFHSECLMEEDSSGGDDKFECPSCIGCSLMASD